MRFPIPLLLFSISPILSSISRDRLTLDFESPVFSTISLWGIIPSASRMV
jgi:hypothetical protein